MAVEHAWILRFVGAFSLLLSGGLLWAAQRRFRLWRQVADTPTARVRSAPMGAVELSGLAQPLEAPLDGPFSGIPCCWWRITVEQEEIHRTKNGTRREWRQIHESSSEEPFWLEDAGSRVRILPVGAELQAPRLVDETRGGGLQGVVGLAGGWLRRIGQDRTDARTLESLPGPQTLQWASGGLLSARRRLREWRIDVQRPLYVLGVLRQQPGLGPVVGQGRLGEPFLISTESETELVGRLKAGTLGWVLGAAGVLALGLGLLVYSNQ